MLILVRYYCLTSHNIAQMISDKGICGKNVVVPVRLFICLLVFKVNSQSDQI